jgi:hypothetical protein
MHINPILLEIFTLENFGFLKDCLIHKEIGSMQEGIHSLEIYRRPISVIKLDLSKEYDRVSWLYLQLLLLKFGFDLLVVNWVTACVSFAFFLCRNQWSGLFIFLCR